MDTQAFLIQLARQAGSLLLDYSHQADLQTQLKADRSVVTAADIAADHLIADSIHQQFPGEILLSEELHPNLPAGWALSDEPVWVIDPIDGTTNFSLGLQIWGVVIARLVAGCPETAVLYFPALEELYTAQKDQGAYLNGERIFARQEQDGALSAFFICCSRTFRRYQVSVPYKVRILGSAAYSLCSVARGAALVGFEFNPKVWDIAAGWLLVKEAGGVIETFDGSPIFPLRPGVNYAQQSFPTISAATTELAGQTRTQIRPLKQT